MRLSERKIPWISLALLALASAIAFGPALENGFVRWDDYHLIINNPLIASHSWRIFASYDPELYIPFTLLTYQIEHFFAGFDPFVFHLDNLLLHIIGTWLTFRVLTILLRDKTLALLGALIFAIHPLQTEAVSWASGRKELLFTAFLLGSVFTYLRAGRTMNLASIILFTLSLLSKPTALILPLLLPLIDWWYDGQFTKKSITKNWPYWVLATVFGVIALFGRGDTVSLLSRFETILLAFRSTAFYLGKFFVPVHLSAIYPGPTDLALASQWQILSMFTVLGLAIIAYITRKRFPELLMGLGWFLITLLPTFFAYAKSNVVTLGADRYMYLPLLGLTFMVVALLGRFSVRIAAMIVMILLIAFIPLDRHQADTWLDTQSLFGHVLRIYPESAIALNNIGFQVMQEGNLPEAQGYFEKAVAIEPNYAEALLNLGVATARQEDYVNALRYFQKAIELDPNLVQARYSLAGIYLKKNDYEQAVKLYRETLNLDADYVPALWQLTQVLVKLNRLDEAKVTYKHLLELDASYAGQIPELDSFLL